MTLPAYCSRNNVPYKVMENLFAQYPKEDLGGESRRSSYGRASAKCYFIAVISSDLKLEAVMRCGNCDSMPESSYCGEVCRPIGIAAPWKILR